MVQLDFLIFFNNLFIEISYAFCCTCLRRVWSLQEFMTLYTLFPKRNGKDSSKNHHCKKCGKLFSTELQLAKHQIVHVGVYNCNQCGRGFPAKFFRDIHMKAHKEEDSKRCQYCKKVFSSVQAMKNHLSIHTGVFRFKCAKCNKGFNDKRNYEKHMKTHELYSPD